MDGNDKYVGRVLDNRYEIIELIGTGGMALVYKARCHRLNRMVAIKILKDDLAGDDEFRRRFHTESQAVAMLSHPNIVAVYDVSRSGSTEYIVMELIEGITLKQYINRKGLLNWKEALHFTTQVTKALGHAHSRGIIHRDIKPHNIMILKDGSVKVADFGIARLLTMQNTLTQEALGSVHYISPEQAKGGYVDARSDIYSVGVVMYEMLTSRLPFVGDSAVSVAIQHISAIPLMPTDINPDIPIGLENITMRAMEPDLALRFTTADEMLYDLEEFRKNPAIVFNYSFTEQRSYDRITEEVIDEDGTKLAAPITPVKPERVVPTRRPTAKKPEMTRSEHRDVKKRAASTTTLVGIVCIVVVLVVLLIFMWNYFLRDIFAPPEREMITIPNFVNRLYNDVIRDRDYDEFFNFMPPVYRPSDEYPEGIIIEQSPTADSQRNAPSSSGRISIELTVSSGEAPPSEMPYLLDRHYSLARNHLLNQFRALALEVVLEPIVSALELRDIVIETIPETGGLLSRGDMVIIRYGAGPDIELREVPDLRGFRREVLESVFDTEGLVPIFIEVSDASEEGTILTITRRGEMVPAGTQIIVHVSSGPAEEPTVVVPDFRGSTIAALEQAFEALGLVPVITRQTDQVAEGIVIDIDRLGDEVPHGSSINVYVSSGPPEVTPTPQPSPDPTPTPTPTPPEPTQEPPEPSPDDGADTN